MSHGSGKSYLTLNQGPYQHSFFFMANYKSGMFAASYRMDIVYMLVIIAFFVLSLFMIIGRFVGMVCGSTHQSKTPIVVRGSIGDLGDRNGGDQRCDALFNLPLCHMGFQHNAKRINLEP